MKNSNLRYGIVGAGTIAERKHLAGYSKVHGVEICTICDENIERAQVLGQKYNIPNVFSDYKKMFDEMNLDFISICTPNYLHAPIAISALERGIDVHCEKPIAINAVEAQKIVDAKDKYKRKVMVALNNRFTNNAFFMKRYIEGGGMGEIYHAKCGWVRRRGIPSKGGWFTDKSLSGGGSLIDLGVHFLDLTLYLAGNMDAETVTAQTYSKFSNNNCLNSWAYGKKQQGIYDVEDMATGFIRLKGGLTLDFEFSWASNIEKDSKYCSIFGTESGITLCDDRVKIYSELRDTNVDLYPNTNYTGEQLNEFQHFVDFIREDMEPLAKPEEAVKVMKIIDAIYKSARTGSEVVLHND